MKKLAAAITTAALLAGGLSATAEASEPPPKGLTVTWRKGSRKVASLLPPVERGRRPCMLDLNKVDIDDPLAGGAWVTVKGVPRSLKPNDKFRWRIDGKIVNAAGKTPKALANGKGHFKTASIPKRLFGRSTVLKFSLFNYVPQNEVKRWRLRSVFTFRAWKVRPGPDQLLWKRVYRSPLNTQCTEKAPLMAAIS